MIEKHDIITPQVVEDLKMQLAALQSQLDRPYQIGDRFWNGELELLLASLSENQAGIIAVKRGFRKGKMVVVKDFDNITSAELDEMWAPLLKFYSRLVPNVD